MTHAAANECFGLTLSSSARSYSRNAAVVKVTRSTHCKLTEPVRKRLIYRSAMSAAKAWGKPYTPVLMAGNATLSKVSCSANLRQFL